MDMTLGLKRNTGYLGNFFKRKKNNNPNFDNVNIVYDEEADLIKTVNNNNEEYILMNEKMSKSNILKDAVEEYNDKKEFFDSIKIKTVDSVEEIHYEDDGTLYFVMNDSSIKVPFADGKIETIDDRIDNSTLSINHNKYLSSDGTWCDNIKHDYYDKKPEGLFSCPNCAAAVQERTCKYCGTLLW